MSMPKCISPQSTFTGSSNVSHVAKERCTGTGGYVSNIEIDEIVAKGNVQSFIDSTHFNILVYNSMEWVAYMGDTTKAQREATCDVWNFAGTTDWAVDIQKFLLNK
ncbi:hypothetical protein CCHL11_06095 [Colletotrichum chlorophyti]|uniref:Uncharacterized protein n=1 Tax=Colletotrichum chlorophyti TaxID=708187 RepID=A0A1Q8RT28_9PEZI|nr:hypothetical protein CCHL11_06095 [Colletotrichum chlorophyti]